MQYPLTTKKTMTFNHSEPNAVSTADAGDSPDAAAVPTLRGVSA
jgi:hypothetical protein